MKILLLNDNPVVNKLVTLSAQKTSDELDVVDSIDSLQPGEYDLLVVDDTMYNDDMFSEIKSKIMFSKSLYICSRDAAKVEVFSWTLKKPFLPTDLVELFLKVSKEVNTSSSSKEETITDLDELEEFGTQELKLEEEVTKELDLDELEEFGEELVLDEDLDFSLDDELEELDDDLLLEDDELLLEDEELEDLTISDEDIEDGESVLDDEEAQKVKDLLDETSDESIAEYDAQVAADELGLPLEEVEEFIQDFIVQAKEFKTELYDSVASRDLDQIKILSHKLKGVAANLRIEQAINPLDIVNSSSDSEEIESHLNNFYKVIDKLEVVESSSLLEVNTSSSMEEEETTNLDELEEFNTEELELDEELELGEELTLDEDELEFDEELTLDEEELELELDEELTPDKEELEIDEELTPDKEELEPESEEEPELDDELLLEEDILEEIEAEVTEEVEEPGEELDLETQIENAVEELSDEDLESELGEETLLEIAANEIDSIDAFDSLTSNDLKLAIGEEVNTETSDMVSDTKDLESFEETKQEANSIEALENLLAALKDKNIAASLKGQKIKIKINITIGDE